MAEVIFAHHVAQAGYSGSFIVDSAGTAGYHQGEGADPRSRACARRHGLEITHRARAVVDADFARFDLLLAMDEANAADLRRRAPDPKSRRKVRLLREWDPAGPGEVPDPYYGEEGDFENVWHLCERSAPGLLGHLIEKEKR